MKSSVLILRGLTYYWRTNIAVVLGVATAVSVLAGALLVGDSVRGSLRDLVLQRLGRTDHVVVSTGFFSEELAGRLAANPEFHPYFAGIAPIVVTQGFVTAQSGGGRSGQVRVYGIDERFWEFHGGSGPSGLGDRDALISPALAAELGAGAGETILVRVQRPTDVPLESIHGRKEDLGSTIRASVQSVIPRESLGEFSLDAQQGDVRAVFLPLQLLQGELEAEGRVNVLLVSAQPGTEATEAATSALKALVRTESDLADLGLGLRQVRDGEMTALESAAGLLDDAVVLAAIEAAGESGIETWAIFTYLANSMRAGERELPYSLVTAIDLQLGNFPADVPPIVLTDWAARDLQARIGDPLTMEYYVWEEPGRLVTRTSEFRVAGVVPLNTGDPDLAPVYPGITEAVSLSDWNPPFPIDLRKIRPIDEDFWRQHRTTPKAFIPLEVGQELWGSRYGALTSIRFTAGPDYAERLRAKTDSLATGLAVTAVRAQSLEASRGATNFGEYFVYFSFFLVVSALLLAALFFKLSVEQRSREVGLLRAVGFRSSRVRRQFLGEGFLLSLAGAVVGIIGGIGYAALVIKGLGTWWIGAVGTTALALHVSAVSLVAGAVGGVLAATVCVWITLRGLAAISERSLLAGELAAEAGQVPRIRRKGTTVLIAAIAFVVLGAGMLAGASAGIIPEAAAFFGAGSALLVACLYFFVFWVRRPVGRPVDGRGWWPVSRLGMRNATYRPTRSVVSIATIASATFILISVDAFRREGGVGTGPQSGVGGYSLMVDSLVPLVHEPMSPEGREILGLGEFDSIPIEPFRVRPGDDASCLNLYEPRNPRILAPSDGFIDQGRFVFQDSMAANEAERANPWRLLQKADPDGAVPVIADANSMTYALHRKLGDEIVIPYGDGSTRLRIVAALNDSIFQGELLMSQDNFVRLFPDHEGYQFLLMETPGDRIDAVSAAVEDALADYGADAKSTVERLAEFHRVENTYLSTFQMLGGLGLLLGTVGLGAVLLRNVLERRRELALLRALGYKQLHLFAIVIAENLLVLVTGLVFGVLCAFLAIAPVLIGRGGGLPGMFLIFLLGGVLAGGLVTSLIATAAAFRSHLLDSLRAE